MSLDSDQPPGGSAHLYPLPIGLHEHRPVLCRREDRRPHGPVALDYGRVWMAEPVVAPAAENDAPGLQAVEQLLSARSGAAVVWGFEDDQPARIEACQDGSLSFSTDVARQDDRYRTYPDFQDDRVVIPDPLTLPIGRWGMQHTHFDLAHALGVARPDGPPRH